ncbi:MAG: galactokinase [Bacteroidetes bacterium]|nr:galactokinase [Bacteroidota bacterium]
MNSSHTPSDYFIDLNKTFFDFFGNHPHINIEAPGRINIIGEHLDYNDGLVMPAAIDKFIYFSVGKRTDSRVVLKSIDLEAVSETENINSFELRTDHAWPNHLLGVIKEFSLNGIYFSSGINVCFGGNIPNGAGLSSSAAVEAGIGTALNILFDCGFDKLKLAQIAQLTEHKYVGVKCGIMDMFASIFSQKDHLIQLDCRDFSHKYVSGKFVNHEFILVNSGVKHTLADSQYNIRRKQCESGLATLKSHFPQIKSFRDVKSAHLEVLKELKDPKILERCQYVTEEIQRVFDATQALENNDMKQLGALLNGSHHGLSEKYEVSCEELDFLQSEALKINGVLGARMMGGGFGGCTLNLVEKGSEDSFREKISDLYEKRFGIKPEIYVVNTGHGVTVVE